MLKPTCCLLASTETDNHKVQDGKLPLKNLAALLYHDAVIIGADRLP